MPTALRLVAGGSALGAALLVPTAAHADGEYLRIQPSTIQSGVATPVQIGLDAYCGDNVNPAQVTSTAFSPVTLSPHTDPRTGRVTLSGAATIPAGLKPGRYDVKLSCASGATASTPLVVLRTPPTSTRGPHTGGGGLAGRNDGTTLMSGGVAAIGGGAVLYLLARRRRALR